MARLDPSHVTPTVKLYVEQVLGPKSILLILLGKVPFLARFEYRKQCDQIDLLKTYP